MGHKTPKAGTAVELQNCYGDKVDSNDIKK